MTFLFCRLFAFFKGDRYVKNCFTSSLASNEHITKQYS